MARILKVACVFEDGLNPYFFQIDQRRPVDDIVREVCEHVGKPDPSQWAFKVPIGKNEDGTEVEVYVNAENKELLKDGTVLKLSKSPAGTADSLRKKLNAPNPNDCLKELHKEANDSTFSKLFVAAGGLIRLKEIIDQLLSSGKDLIVLGFALNAFHKLVTHLTDDGKNPWKNYDDGQFYNAIIKYIKKGDIPPMVVRSSLQIAGAYVRHTDVEQGFASIYNTKNNGLKFVTEHLKSPDSIIQEAAVMLINAINKKCPDRTKKELSLVIDKLNVKGHLSQRVQQGQVPESFAHELYVLQTHLLKEKGVRARYNFNHEDNELVGKLASLKEPLVAAMGEADVDEMSLLGFTDLETPEKDFTSFPGVLALDNIAYFARHYEDIYRKLVLDQRNRPIEYMCPFVLGAKKLSELLLDILDVDKTVDSKSTQYLSLFYQSKGSSFEEVFGVAVQLLHKTWKEMDAKVCDIEKVIKLVKKQLLNIMSQPEKMPHQVDKFKQILFNHPYANVKADYLTVAESSFERQLKSEALVNLRASKRDEFSEVVKEQRLASMTEGMWFRKIKPTGKEDFLFFVRLSKNHKELRWSEVNEQATWERNPPFDLINSKEVDTLAWVEFGSEIPVVKNNKQNGAKLISKYNRLMFAFNSDQEEWVNCIAKDRVTASIWMDGIRLLMGKRVYEPETRTDIDELVATAMNLVLLNLAELAEDLPHTTPDIPKEPSNLDFNTSEDASAI